MSSKTYEAALLRDDQKKSKQNMNFAEKLSALESSIQYDKDQVKYFTPSVPIIGIHPNQPRRSEDNMSRYAMDSSDEESRNPLRDSEDDASSTEAMSEVADVIGHLTYNSSPETVGNSAS